jgi:hypothetical protein
MPLPDIGQMSYSRWLGPRVEKAGLRSPGYATLEKERTFGSKRGLEWATQGFVFDREDHIGWVLVPMHQSALNRVDRGLRSVAYVHFVKYAAHMDAHGFLGNTQLLSDVTVALSTRNVGEYFMLAGG